MSEFVEYPLNMLIDNALRRLEMLAEDTGVLTPADMEAIRKAIAGEGRLSVGDEMYLKGVCDANGIS